MVDRNKQQIVGKDKEDTLNIWAGKWRVPDESPNVDHSKCEPGGSIGKILTPKCENPLVYTSSDWCGRVKDPNGPWSQCLEKFEKSLMRTLFETCVYDVCAFEKDPAAQNETLCQVYQEVTADCLEISSKLNLNWKFDWRTVSNCRKLSILVQKNKLKLFKF